MIRKATEADVREIVELGRQFLLDGPYKDIIEDHPQVPTELAHKLLSLPETACILVDDDHGLNGIVAFIIYPHFYSGVLTAQEIIWYVKPEARNSFVPIALMRAAERNAREMGAKYMQFSAPTENVGKLYEMCKYKQIEVGYQKELTCQQSRQA